ncbi:hypothetical protein [Chlamydiifrater phoenicopteri]|uniref:hypothetical protein n=1 Tax=Chlamydiifrater phoenicopteri TaxID=2681469 RepID=UPI001BCD915B|nr:hypothetical protein [Chlamydiifrater phoenicopteri]
MNKKIPFGKAFLSLGLHLIFIALLSMNVTEPKRPPIKLREHFVGTFTERSSPSELRKNNSVSPSALPKSATQSTPLEEKHPIQKTPHAQEKTTFKEPTSPKTFSDTKPLLQEKNSPDKALPSKTPSTLPKETKNVKDKPLPSSTKTASNTKEVPLPQQNKKALLDNQRNEKLRELAKMANEMTRRLEADNKRLHDPVLRKTAIFVSSGDPSEEFGELNPETLTQLLRKHLVLPLPGILRMQLSISPKGELLNCSVYESETELNKQYVLSKIHEISFEDFVKKHKNSKNISLHIKLVGEP